MVLDHYQKQYPNPFEVPAVIWPDITELLRKARLYDELMKQADCPDPKKEEWLNQLRQFQETQKNLKR